MSDLNQHHKQYLSTISKKLSGAMGKVKFYRTMSADEVAAISKDIGEIQLSLNTFIDINPDVKYAKLFKQAADLTEELFNVLARPSQHLV